MQISAIEKNPPTSILCHQFVCPSVCLSVCDKFWPQSILCLPEAITHFQKSLQVWLPELFLSDCLTILASKTVISRLKNYLETHHLQEGMKFATQISLLHYFNWCWVNNPYSIQFKKFENTRLKSNIFKENDCKLWNINVLWQSFVVFRRKGKTYN